MSIYICDDFLSETDLIRFQEYVTNHSVSQKVIEDSTFSESFWKTYGEQICKLDPKCTGVASSVTVTHTSAPIGRHKDINHHGEHYKALIYLNSIPKGGTLFYPPTGTQLVENKPNRLVLFDMDILHESQKFDYRQHRTKKMAIGFRVLTSI